MTKKTKGIIIGGSAAVILLAGALVALKLTEPASEEEDNLASTSDSASSSESRLLYDKNPSDIAKVTITNEKGTLDVERYADDFWTIPDVSGLPLNYTAIQGIIDECASVTAKQTVVESADDISIYGLDSPTITAEITFDGTNASDDAGDRPGMKALEELKVLSPLRLCGYTKDEIRKQAKNAGLFLWNKPAYACLATRIKPNEEITPNALNFVEKAEMFMMNLGFKNIRVRVSQNEATIILKDNNQELLKEKRNIIEKEFSQYFNKVNF